MIDFKFGVLDYSRTYANHCSRLAKYRAACEKDDKLKFTWKNEPAEHAGIIMGNTHSPLSTKNRIKTDVNYHFITEIQQYLRQSNQSKYWLTAVYMDCYEELNKYMNEVANVIAGVTMKK